MKKLFNWFLVRFPKKFNHITMQVDKKRESIGIFPKTGYWITFNKVIYYGHPFSPFSVKSHLNEYYNK